MDFREAMERAGRRVTTEEVARALGVSVYSVKQERLHSGSEAHRTPPQGWERVLARLARERGDELHGLAEDLEGRG